jgi:Zinc knuckle/Retrotransposon gag protein
MSGDRFGALEDDLRDQRTAIANLTAKLEQLTNAITSQSLPLPPPHPPPPPSIPLAPSVPSIPSTRRAKPSAPSEFDGVRSKGWAFLNSCELYLNLVPDQFPDDQSRVLWVLSFMKAGRAARFADRVLRHERTTRTPRFPTFTDFRTEFILEFCPKNEEQEARLTLEGDAYYQGSRSVEEYIDDFTDYVEKAGYTEGTNIVLKFRHGLSPTIQREIATLTVGRPADDNPNAWYAAARINADNRLANKSFTTAHHHAPTKTFVTPKPQSGTTSVPSPYFRSPPVFSTSSAPAAKDPNAMEVDASRTKGKTNLNTCFRCKQTGHFARDCPLRFDVRFLTAEEKDELVMDHLATQDVAEVLQRSSEKTEEVGEDFLSHSE